MGFLSDEQSEEGHEKVGGKRPWLLVVSPPCTMFSNLQNLTLEKRDADEVRKQLKEAVKHLTFAVYMCTSKHHRQK